MRHPSSAPDVGLAIRRSRRDGIDRLFLVGALDRASVLTLEGELTTVARARSGLILDLRELTSIDRWGLHTLERVARRSGPGTSRLSIVNGRGPVLHAFEAAGIGELLSGTDRSDPLDSVDGAWSPISPPPLPGQRAGRHLRVAEERP